MEGSIVEMGALIGAGLACTGMGGAASRSSAWSLTLLLS